MGNALAYRPFIDGLRALSIIAVVGFHVGLPGFGGGFVGVDVFFVISGFLIIGQIGAALRTGRFTFTSFYARRVMRILPPLLVVLVAAIAAAPFILVTPREYDEFGRSATASALMYANHYFLDQQGYFDTRSDLKPLLHLWTLSVEEQFYLVAPLLLLGLARLAALRRRPVETVWLRSTAILAVLSLIGCILLTRHGRNYGFYLMPLRGWEFMAGGALGIALPAGPRLARHGRILAFAGLAAILAAIVLYGDRLYPSAWALAPAGGAALVIYAGLVAPDNPVARLLSLRPLVAIGLVSYSWYLWHWPLLAFSRITEFGDRHLGTGLAMAFISLLLAAATYWAIERPARAWRRQAWAQRKRTVAAGLLACACGAVLGLGLADIVAPRVAQALPPGLWPPPVERLVEQGDVCAIRNDARLDPRCLAEAGGAGFGLLFGDSHARALYQVLRAETERHGKRLISLFSLGCAPLLSPSGTYSPTNAEDCAERNDAALRSIAAAVGDRLGFAVIEASWLYYSHDAEPTFSAATAAAPANDPPSADDPAAKLGVRVAETIQRLVDMHVRRIILVGPVPLTPRSVPACLIRADREGGNRDSLCAYSRATSDSFRAPVVAMLRTVARRFPTVRYVDPIDSFCDQKTCRSAAGDTAFFADQQHLTDAGARRFLDTAPADFLWAFAGGTAAGQ